MDVVKYGDCNGLSWNQGTMLCNSESFERREEARFILSPDLDLLCRNCLCQ